MMAAPTRALVKQMALSEVATSGAQSRTKILTDFLRDIGRMAKDSDLWADIKDRTLSSVIATAGQIKDQLPHVAADKASKATVAVANAALGAPGKLAGAVAGRAADVILGRTKLLMRVNQARRKAATVSPELSKSVEAQVQDWDAQFAAGTLKDYQRVRLLKGLIRDVDEQAKNKRTGPEMRLSIKA